MELAEVAIWALKQNYHLDHSNACVHCAPVRYSPLTFRLAEALDASGEHLKVEERVIMNTVLGHLGTYAEDPGR